MSSRSPPPVGPSPQFAARHPKIHRPAPLSLKKLPEPPLSNLRLEEYNILPSTVYSPEFDEPRSEDEESNGQRRGRSATPTDISGLFNNSETETSSSSSATSSRSESPIDRDGGVMLRQNSERVVRVSEVEKRLNEQDVGRNSGTNSRRGSGQNSGQKSRRDSRRGSGQNSERNSGRNSGRRTPSTPVTPMSPNYPPPLPPSSSSSNRPSIFSGSSNRISVSTPPSSPPRATNESRSISPRSSTDFPGELEWTPVPAIYSTRPPPSLTRRPSKKMKAVLGMGMVYPPNIQSPIVPKHPPITAPAPISAMYAPIAAPPSSVSVKRPVAKVKGLKEKEKKEKLPEKPKESPKHPPKAAEKPKEKEKLPEKPKESPKHPPKAAEKPKEKEKPKDPILDNWDVTDSDSSANRKSLPKPQPQELKPWKPLAPKRPSISTAPSTAVPENTPPARPARPLKSPRLIEHPQPRPAVAMRAISRSASTASDGYKPTHHSRRASKGEQLEVAFKLVTTATEGRRGQVYPGAVGGSIHTQSSADIRTARGPRSRGREELDSVDFFTIDPLKRSPSAPIATRSLTDAFKTDEDGGSDLEYMLDEYPVLFSTLPGDEASIFNIAPSDLAISDMFHLPSRPKSQAQSQTQVVRAHQIDGEFVPTYTIHPSWIAPDNEEIYAAAERQRKEELAALAAMMDPAGSAAVSFRARYNSGLESIMCSPTTTTFPTRPPTISGSPNVSPTTATPMGPAMSAAIANMGPVVPATPTTPVEPSPGSIQHSSRWSDYSEAESIKESWRASVFNHFHLPRVATVRRKLVLKGGVAAAKEGIRKISANAPVDLRLGSGTRDTSSSAETQRKSTESHKVPLTPFAPTNHRASISSSGLVSRVGNRIANGRSDSIATLGRHILTRPESRSDHPPIASIRSNSMNSHSRRPDISPPSTAATMPALGSTLSTLSLVPNPDGDDLVPSLGSRRFKGVFEKYMVKDPRKKDERRRMELKKKITVIGAGQGPGGYI